MWGRAFGFSYQAMSCFASAEFGNGVAACAGGITVFSSGKSPAMNEMLPQPPPDAPLPPPSEAAIRSQQRRDWILIVGLLSVLCVIAIASAPLFIRQRKCRGVTEAVSNARQVGLALMEFESEYGSFPDDSTRQLVQERNPGNTIPLGTSSSNDYFRQLIAAEMTTSEVMFYARTPGTHKPDNVMTGKRALEKGECGFAYVYGLSSAGNPNRPLVLYPVVPGKLLFNRKLHDGTMVMLKMDNSVTSLPIDKSGRAIFNGKDLFDPSQPFWGGKVPVVKWPE